MLYTKGVIIFKNKATYAQQQPAPLRNKQCIGIGYLMLTTTWFSDICQAVWQKLNSSIYYAATFSSTALAKSVHTQQRKNPSDVCAQSNRHDDCYYSHADPISTSPRKQTPLSTYPRMQVCFFSWPRLCPD